jgi:hypothetical protein
VTRRDSVSDSVDPQSTSLSRTHWHCRVASVPRLQEPSRRQWLGPRLPCHPRRRRRAVRVPKPLRLAWQGTCLQWRVASPAGPARIQHDSDLMPAAGRGAHGARTSTARVTARVTVRVTARVTRPRARWARLEEGEPGGPDDGPAI